MTDNDKAGPAATGPGRNEDLMTDPRGQRAEFVTAHLRPEVHISLQSDGEQLGVSDVIEVHDNLINLAREAGDAEATVETSQHVPLLNGDGHEQWVNIDHATPDQLNDALMVAAAEIAALQREALAVMERGIVLAWMVENPQTTIEEV